MVLLLMLFGMRLACEGNFLFSCSAGCRMEQWFPCFAKFCFVMLHLLIGNSLYIKLTLAYFLSFKKSVYNELNGA